MIRGTTPSAALRSFARRLVIHSTLPKSQVLVLAASIAFCLFAPTAFAQAHGGGSHSTTPPSPPAKVIRPDASDFDKDQMILQNQTKDERRRTEQENTCLLPPLNFVHSPAIAVTSLQVSARALKEYAAACSALKEKKFDTAESRLRKTVEVEPKYPAAWVTLGQTLAARQKIDEAQRSCAQALAVDPNYLLSSLCLADIALRAGKWEEALKYSDRALQLDPASDPVAYGYNAAANLNLNRLAVAQESALKALAIDKNNSDPRLHFLMAQIYEARKNSAAEAAELKEYLKFATDPADVAMVKQYLSALEGGLSK
jgi:predicted Zn-dependent protease